MFFIGNFCWSKFKHAPHLITDWLQKDHEFKLITVIILKLAEMTAIGSMGALFLDEDTAIQVKFMTACIIFFKKTK